MALVPLRSSIESWRCRSNAALACAPMWPPTVCALLGTALARPLARSTLAPPIWTASMRPAADAGLTGAPGRWAATEKSTRV